MQQAGRQTEYRGYSAQTEKEEDDFDIEITEEDIRNYDLLGKEDQDAPLNPGEEIRFERIGEPAPVPAEEKKKSPAEEKSKAAGKRRIKWRFILPALLLCVLVIVGIRIAGILSCRQGAAEYLAYDRQILSGMETPEKDGAIPDPEIDWDGLEKINPDLAGVLYIPALNLAVPYTAGEEASYALTHTFSGEESPVGSIRCSEDTDAAFSGMNAVLLGASPADGSLFGGFRKLLSHPNLLQDQPCVYVFTKQWRRRYEVFAGFTAMNTDPVLRAVSTEEKYRYYLSLAASRNVLDGMEDISAYTQQGEPYLTLCAGSDRSRTYSRYLCCILTGEERND